MKVIIKMPSEILLSFGEFIEKYFVSCTWKNRKFDKITPLSLKAGYATVCTTRIF